MAYSAVRVLVTTNLSLVFRCVQSPEEAFNLLMRNEYTSNKQTFLGPAYTVESRDAPVVVSENAIPS